MSDYRSADALAAILQDLIAELRMRHIPATSTQGTTAFCRHCADLMGCGCCSGGVEMDIDAEVEWPCSVAHAADRAEARLREVQGE